MSMLMSGEYTPMRPYTAPAGLSNGPSMFNVVRTYRFTLWLSCQPYISLIVTCTCTGACGFACQHCSATLAAGVAAKAY